MMLDATHLALLWDTALKGLAQPWVICAALALTTLLLEDVAIAAGVAVATQGAVSWEWAFVSVAGGIALGDLGLYGLGKVAMQVAWLREKYINGKEIRVAQILRREWVAAVFLARVIPGLRLVTYTACGFLHIPFLPFTLWVCVAVVLWTAGLFGFSATLGSVIAQRWNLPEYLAVMIPIVVIVAAIPLVRWLQKCLKKSYESN